MGQIFQPENFPALVVASTSSVTIAATANGAQTRINIGGQQYAPSAQLTLSTAGTGANGLDTGALGAIQLWYVYAIVNNSSFVPALVASQNNPSTGPTMPSGYGTAYKLVGAFYTNGSSQVGSTVTITGPATSGWFTAPSYTMISNGAITSPTTNKGMLRRNGNVMEFRGDWGTGTANVNTSNNVTFNMPSSFTIDSTAIVDTAFRDQLGSAHYLGTATGPVGTLEPMYGSSTAVLFRKQGGSGTGIYLIESDLATNWQLNFILSLPIQGWNATLL